MKRPGEYVKTVLAVMALVLGSAALAAQNEIPAHGDIPPAVIEALAREAPLGQSDIDAYLRIMPELPRLLAEPSDAEKTAAGLNLSPLRFSYILAKVPLTMALASGADPKTLALDSLPQVLRPSEEELALIKKNLEVLSQAADEADKALAKTGAGPGAAPR